MSYVVRRGLGEVVPADAPKCTPVPCIPVPCRTGITGWMLVAIAAAGFGLKIIQFGRGAKI